MNEDMHVSGLEKLPTLAGFFQSLPSPVPLSATVSLTLVERLQPLTLV